MIIYKTKEEIEGIRESGKILADVLQMVCNKAKVGVSTLELNDFATKEIKNKGGEPSFLKYNDFPASLCTSVNYQVVHSVPLKEEILAEGDVVGLDLGVNYKGYFSDMARTVVIGEPSEEVKKLVETTKEALKLGIKAAKIGNHVGDIGKVVQEYAEERDFSVVKSLVGHGVGKAVHEEPAIPNFGKAGEGPELKEGMVIAIEPMVNMGSHEIELGDDQWTYVTKDRKLSAHFEHTIAVGKDGGEILTKTSDGKDFY